MMDALRNWLAPITLRYCFRQLDKGRVGLRYRFVLWIDDLLEGSAR